MLGEHRCIFKSFAEHVVIYYRTKDTNSVSVVVCRMNDQAFEFSSQRLKSLHVETIHCFQGFEVTVPSFLEEFREHMSAVASYDFVPFFQGLESCIHELAFVHVKGVFAAGRHDEFKYFR